MRRLRRALPLLAAVVLLGLAAVLALFASDVRAWQGGLTNGDLRFRAQRSHVGLWGSPALLPDDPARSLLGLGDALSYRRALQLFWFSIVGSSTGGQADLAATRVAAESQLQALMTTAATAEERSTAANLLGVMTATTPADSPTQKATVAAATRYFERAVVADPRNYDAKLNLELMLRIQRPGKSRLDQDARGGFGFGGANGVGVIGGGY
jgi:alternate signal-mediated exported protein